MNSVKPSPELSWANCEAIKQVFNQSQARGTTFTVLLALAAHAGKSGTAWPSLGRLAALARTSVRSVRRALRELEALGEIVTLRQAGKNGTNVYRIELARGAVNLSPEGTGARGGQSVPRRGPVTEDPTPVNPSRGAVNLSPEHNREENKEKISPLPPSTEPGVAPREEEEEASKLSPKAEAIKDALGPELFAQLEMLYTERAPRSRFVLWLETALHPELERLGRETFRAALAHHLAAAAGDGIRHPSRFLVAKLKEEAPAASAALPEALPDLAAQLGESAAEPAKLEVGAGELASGSVGHGRALADREGLPEGMDTGGGGEAPGASDAPASNPFARYLRRSCRYGDHAAGDACCLPKALETLAWVVPELERPGRDPKEAALLKETARAAYRKVMAEPDGWAEALDRLGKKKGDALRALKALGIRGPTGVGPAAAKEEKLARLGAAAFAFEAPGEAQARPLAAHAGVLPVPQGSPVVQAGL